MSWLKCIFVVEYCMLYLRLCRSFMLFAVCNRPRHSVDASFMFEAVLPQTSLLVRLQDLLSPG